jgi:hypothetical protein
MVILTLRSELGQLNLDLQPREVLVEVRRVEEPNSNPIPSVPHC